MNRKGTWEIMVLLWGYLSSLFMKLISITQSASEPHD